MKHSLVPVLSSFLFVLGCVTVAGGRPIVTTDRPRYVPGESVLVSGTGWVPGQPVTLTFGAFPAAGITVTLGAVADETGAFSNGAFTVAPSDSGMLLVEALQPATGSWSEAVFFGPQSPCASVTTDKANYFVGETVAIAGEGWAAGETVALTIGEVPAAHAPTELSAVADGNGAFTLSEFVIAPDDTSTQFTLDATGLTSGATVRLLFADGPTEPAPAYLFQWGTYGKGDGQFTSARGIALGGAAEVYVVDARKAMDARVQKFTNAGSFLMKWGSAGSGDGQFFEPWGVATNAAGDVYVADGLNHRVQKFTSGGVFITKWGSYGKEPGQFCEPQGIATDASGNVYVADVGNHRVQKFTGDGTHIRSWYHEFDRVWGIATDAVGDVYVTDAGRHNVQKFTGDGTFLTQWGSMGAADGQFYWPAGITVDAGGSVYVADRGNMRVQKFRSDGMFLTKWGSKGWGDGEFYDPMDVEVDAAGRIYVVDSGNDRVQVFGPTTGSVHGRVTAECAYAKVGRLLVNAVNLDCYPKCDVYLASTDRDGAYAIQGMIPGHYQVDVKLSQPGFETGPVNVVLQAGESLTADFPLVRTPPWVEITGPSSGSVYPVNTAVDFSANFGDGLQIPHTAAWTLDGISIPGEVTPPEQLGGGTVTGSYTFTAPGVYSVRLTVTEEACGASTTASTVGGLDAFIVVYDPSAGFVTGGGWILSPAGAYPADPALTGKATFGFVSKYARGAATPSGETEFQFKAGALNFHSTSYEWLVVAGARAQYKGDGTINGAGDYGFMLTAIDGQVNGGGGADKFRMKISDKASGLLVYDNLAGASDAAVPTTELGGGSVMVHSSGGAPIPVDAGAREAPKSEPPTPLEFGLGQNRPNPFDAGTAIQFTMPEAGRVRLAIYDISGRAVRWLLDEDRSAGLHQVTWSGEGQDGARVRPGIYFYRVTIEPTSGERGFTSLRRMVLMR